MTQQGTESLGRRDFLKALLVTATAASGVGGGLAYLFNRDGMPATITAVETPSLPLATAAQAIAPATGQGSETLAQMASMQADNMRLRAEVDALQRQLAALSEANGDSSQLNSALQTELAAANNRASLFAGLVALYEELESSELLETVDEGLESFGMAIYELVDGLPGLEDGLSLGQAALDEFEEHVPLLQSGQHWLENHLTVLENVFGAAEDVLSSVVESAGDFFLKLNEWFQGVLKWLPFGVGNTAAEVMSSLTRLLSETPNTINGLRGRVADPLETWFTERDGETPIHGRLFSPLRNKTIAPAVHMAGAIRDTEATYKAQVVEPVKTAQKNRRAIRDQIDAYRKKYEL